MSSSESRSGVVLELAEEFLDRYRAGERPALKEYIDRHPELAAEIREVFPAMAMMENIALADDSLEADATGAHGTRAPLHFEQLGDYRIIREVGRGGMGVVYEAEQVSLGRHVALKVLPAQTVSDSKQKRRFEREAKAAARLHHTNIVPVYGVGEQDGIPYYVMQFIQGLGLDAVLDELKRLRGTKPATPSTIDRPNNTGDLTAAQVARSLMTGRFEPAAAAHALTPVPTEPMTGEEPPPLAAAPRPEPAASGSSSVSLLGQDRSATSRSKSRKPDFAQGVARIGVQVAEALAHAHEQGILHRDIKPSNLLLDQQGTVWVTDFGLAKADDQQNLTHTGDILGTLRYMPPEAFEGRSDRRGDLYSLGLTLYELLGFRPAFDEKDRARLVRQVTTEDPPRLRKLNPEVPRDLETIIHKAIERDPDHRYSSASELAADLQRFVDDEPIKARQVRPAERVARWCRRNPMIATLAASLLLFMAATTIGSLLAARRMSRLAHDEKRSAVRADEQRRTAVSATQTARVAERKAEQAKLVADAQRKQAEANFAQARAAVDDYLTKVTDSQLLTAPGLQPLRRDLLGSALKFYDQFLKDRRDDPALRASRASVLLRVAQIHSELGEGEAWAQALNQAIQTYEVLAREHPRDRETQVGLLRALDARGDATRVIELGESLLEKDPGRRDTRFLLAKGYNRRHMSALTEADYSGSVEALQRCVFLTQSLVEEDPEYVTYESFVGASLNNMASIVSAMGDAIASYPIYRRAAVRMQRVLERQPHNSQFGIEAMNILANLINIESDLGANAALGETRRTLSLGVTDDGADLGANAALGETCRRGRDLARKLATTNPDIPTFAESRVLFTARYGLWLAANQRPDEARAVLREALELWQSPALQSLIATRGNRTTNDLRSDMPLVAAQLAALVDREPEDANRARLAERDALNELSVQLLAKNLDTGVTSRIGSLKDDPALVVLRDREDFKAIADRSEQAGRSGAAPSSRSTTPPRPQRPDPDVVAAEQVRAKAEVTLLGRGDTAALHFAAGMVYFYLKQWDTARKEFLKSIELRESLVRADPHTPEHLFDLGLSRLGLGRLRRDSGDATLALADWIAGRDALSAFLLAVPDDHTLVAFARRVLDNYGSVMLHCGLYDDAEPNLRHSLDSTRDHNEPFNYGLLALLRDDRKAYQLACARAVALMRGSRNKHALANTALMCALTPDSGVAPATFLPLGESAIDESDPNHLWRNLYLATGYYRAGRCRDALREVAKFETIYKFGIKGDDGMTALAATLRALAQHGLGEREDAAKWLEEARALQGALLQRAVARTATQGIGVPHWGWAIARIAMIEAEVLIGGQASDARARNDILQAWGESQVGRVERARALLGRADTATDADAALLAARAHVWVLAGDQEKARRDRDAALRLDPDNVLVLTDLGREALDQDRPLDAADALCRVLVRLPNSRNMEADRFVIDGLLAGSDEAFRRAVDLRPNDPQLWVARGRHLAWNKRWKEAADAYGRVVESLPIFLDWVEYASVLLLAGDIERYRQLCATLRGRVASPDGLVSAWEPSDTLAFAARIGSVHPESGLDPDLVLEWADRALRMKSNRAHAGFDHFYYVAGVCERRARRFNAGIRRATQSIKASPTWQLTTLNAYTLAMVHWQLGELADARRWFERAESATTQRGRDAAKQSHVPQGHYLADDLEARVLHREARSMLFSKETAPSKPGG